MIALRFASSFFKFYGTCAFLFLCVMSMLVFVQAHIELQENLAANQKETLEGLQEATTKLMTQQAEAARYTADTARHIKEVSDPCLENRLRLHFVTKVDCMYCYFFTETQSEEGRVRLIKCIILCVYCFLVYQMTELARSQITGALVVPPDVSDSSMEREEPQSSYSKQRKDKNDSDR